MKKRGWKVGTGEGVGHQKDGYCGYYPAECLPACLKDNECNYRSENDVHRDWYTGPIGKFNKIDMNINYTD
ncbi:MAG: hypothetical protein JRJ65_10210 [Deltaproteobacteria bacterium]|nr:hypothetical protein [Deltaproteobacteria bacterium]